uniref:Uncharacterized protein n=1 Tax=Anguilla anguilla TaxID=7936 RepID=A0A0E9S7U5_ANGAN
MDEIYVELSETVTWSYRNYIRVEMFSISR